MDRKDISELGHMLLDEVAEPKALPLSLLKHITNGFSDDKKIGHGGFAVVYKGMLKNGTVAVKKLLRTLDIDEKQFRKEVHCLMKAKHKNIVRFLGYCSDTQGEMVDYEGELVLADVRERLLCFEYLSHGSLDKHITDASCGLEWKRRYKIINGICEGLYYLHQNNILHLDLKPANILLDYNMVPKIADFGISRFSDENQSGVTTSSMIGTVGYLAPEFYGCRKITYKLDIYSLGIIIIDILTGDKGYPDIDYVLEMWRRRLEKTQRDTQLVQVRLCTEIAIQCIDSNPMNRPDTQYIIDRLGATKSVDESATENIPSHRETSLEIRAEIVGREMEKQKIMARLSGTTQKTTFLPIYGIGGIGKTTMAQSIYRDSQFKAYSRVWIYLSQTFDLKKIGNSIITQLSGNRSELTDLQMIENNLQKLLSGKRVLIILDDLWERESSQLKQLESMLNLGEGAKVVVVVTTREESIAQKIHTERVKPYKLTPLTDDICWTIIKNKTSFETRDERAQLELIGKEIAKKCGGVALAAQSIGYMLDNMDFDEWVSVNNSEIWDVLASGEYSPDHVHASLLLSYSRMDSYLKLCFAYCATFPKGCKIDKEALAHQWISLGLVEPSRPFSDIQTSHKYIRLLFGMCFLEHPRQWTKDVNNRFLIMNDLAHSFARSVLADKINVESPACQYAWLTDHKKLFNSSMNPLDKIRALHFVDHGYLQLHAEAFSPAKCLQVLDLSRCCAQQLPDSIGQLKHLRYLDASWNLEFSESSELQAPLESMLIPKALGSLNKLQYLNLSHRRRPIGLPEVISKLTELRYLNISHYEGYFLLDNPPANQSFIDCIGTLPNLEQLDMSWNDYVFSVPESFSSLKKLNFYGCKHIANLPENVGKMDIPKLFGLLDRQFPVRAVDSESSSNLVWLKHTNPYALDIVDLENVKSVEEAHSIRLMEKGRIENLSLQWSGGVRSVEQKELLTKLVPPSSVKNLKISGYEDVMFPHWFVCINKYLPNLVSLDMWGLPCSSLPTLVQLPNLRKIVIRCTEEFNTDMGVDAANELTFAKLEYLEIDCHQKSSIIPSPARAQYLYISGGDNVLSSLGECASSTAASSSSSPLSKLKIEHSKLPLSRWRLLHHLPGLSDLTISYCDDLTISPQITRAFTSLESLSLGFLRQEKLPEWLGELICLRQLNLDMQYLHELHENMRQLTQLQSLSLHACYTLTSLPQWLGELTFLKTIEINSCVGITSLPQSILTNIEELHISHCPELHDWSKLEGNQMKLARIKEKFISSTFDWRHLGNSSLR